MLKKINKGGCWSYLHKVVSLGAMATVWFLLVVLLGSLQDRATKTWTTRRVVESAGVFKHRQVIGRDNLVYNPKLDRNYMMSKRRVPNGPDPIHNRRAGNSKRPPGRS